MMSPGYGSISHGFSALPTAVGLGATNQVTNANLHQLLKQSQQIAAAQKQMQQSLVRGPAQVANAPTAQQLAAATQNQTLAHQLKTQAQYLAS
jgi:hypothetical protein